MIILLDVDGVVADMVGPLLAWAELYQLSEDIIDYDFVKCLTLEEREEVEAIMERPEFWEHGVGLMYGCRSFESGPVYANHEVHFVTTPYRGCNGMTNARDEWIAECFGDSFVDRVTYTSQKHLVRGDRFLDDKPENVSKWQEWNPEGQAWIFDQPWNRKFDWPRRFMGWTEAEVARFLG